MAKIKGERVTTLERAKEKYTDNGYYFGVEPPILHILIQYVKEHKQKVVNKVNRL